MLFQFRSCRRLACRFSVTRSAHGAERGSKRSLQRSGPGGQGRRASTSGLSSRLAVMLRRSMRREMRRCNATLAFRGEIPLSRGWRSWHIGQMAAGHGRLEPGLRWAVRIITKMAGKIVARDGRTGLGVGLFLLQAIYSASVNNQLLTFFVLPSFVLQPHPHLRVCGGRLDYFGSSTLATS